MILFIYIFVIILVNINCNGYEFNTTPATSTDEIHLNLVRGSQVDMWVSLENVVYCKLKSPRGFVYYDYFGRCRLSLDRVVLEHHGLWEMYVGYTGKATWDMKCLIINVTEPEPKTQVHTVVEETYPNITVTCSVPSEYQIRGCKLRGPQGIMLLATGTTENIVKIKETRFETHHEGSKCSFRIVNPDVSVLGFWRCSMYTEHVSFYGFAKVVSSWHLHDPSVAAIVNQGPLLRADHESIDVNEGEPVIMSCSINAPIRYCYFRMFEDGTIFNVSPGLKSSSAEYVGLGFDAGECGLKLNDFKYSNFTWRSREWSCNVGLATGNQQRRNYWVYIRERMRMHQESNVGGSTINVDGRIPSSQLEYCRFVRDDGYGFAYDEKLSDPRIKFVGSLSEGHCSLDIHEATFIDYAPWTIVAKVIGEDEEVSGTTTGLRYPWNWYNFDDKRNWRIFGWTVLGFIIAMILICCFGEFLNNRKKATTVRQSLHTQPPPPPYTETS